MNSVIKVLTSTPRISLLLRRFKYSKIKPVLDTNYLLDPKNVPEIAENIAVRKGVGDIHQVHKLLSENNQDEKTRTDLGDLLLTIPNKTHPEVKGLGDEPKVIRYYNEKPEFEFKPHQFQEIANKNKWFRMDHLSNFTGHKSYYLMGDLAALEHALVKYTIDRLTAAKFELISVPDILPASVIEGCGFSTKGDRNQVYKLDHQDLCLSGTSEMALAAYFANRTIPASEAPVKKIAFSRCYRAETSGLQEEKGIYRVHQFNKVEMFTVAHPRDSEAILEEFKNIQIDLFDELGLYFKVLDMPPHELGAPAYRKYDIETYMIGRDMWGEISSCSNCTDYQARRLNVKIKGEDEEIFAHTINGTACAAPRMLIALVETYQTAKGSVTIPPALVPYMKKTKIEVKKEIPALKLIKSISSIR